MAHFVLNYVPSLSNKMVFKYWLHIIKYIRHVMQKHHGLIYHTVNFALNRNITQHLQRNILRDTRLCPGKLFFKCFLL